MEVEVKGSSMVPLVYPGTTLLILEGYYKNHPVERYDVIAYDYKGKKWPLMKVIYGVPGDQWGIETHDKSYKIIINNRTAKNASGLEYKIPVNEAKRLKLYSESYPIIPEDTYLILGNKPRGGVDSTVFGLVHKSDFIGKIVHKPTQ